MKKNNHICLAIKRHSSPSDSGNYIHPKKTFQFLQKKSYLRTLNLIRDSMATNSKIIMDGLTFD
ncbi:MAG: hypothetical protein II815_06925, partial [Bacteroidales bacterium]|nr:hypothetical protein [Bacteroidales bacterium]